jgi:hypothetical protein
MDMIPESGLNMLISQLLIQQQQQQQLLNYQKYIEFVKNMQTMEIFNQLVFSQQAGMLNSTNLSGEEIFPQGQKSQHSTEINSQDLQEVLLGKKQQRICMQNPIIQDLHFSSGPRSSKQITNCEHKTAKHYAKGMCSNCYHIKGRGKRAWKCEHKEKQHYALGICQNCYQTKYTKVN